MGKTNRKRRKGVSRNFFAVKVSAVKLWRKAEKKFYFSLFFCSAKKVLFLAALLKTFFSIYCIFFAGGENLPGSAVVDSDTNGERTVYACNGFPLVLKCHNTNKTRGIIKVTRYVMLISTKYISLA